MVKIHLKIDGVEIAVPEGLSVRKAALKNGIYIPGLCSHPELNPFRPFHWSEKIWQGDLEYQNDGSAEDANDFPHCNLCLVSINGSAPQRACTARVENGMEVRTSGVDLVKERRNSLKKILAHHPHACLTCAQREGCDRIQCSMNVPVDERCCTLLGQCEIGKVAEYIGIPGDTPAYRNESRPSITDGSLIIRDYELCINCLRCVRICRDVREVDALGAVTNESRVRVGANLGATLPDSLCRFCGACVEVCPTGALLDHPGVEVFVSGEAPCVARCPLGIDIPGYMELAAAGREVEALHLIRENAVLPGVLGYACFHPCEDACRRNALDEPASICAVKRYIADIVGDVPPSPSGVIPNGKKIAVIGGGPAGLAAAADLLKWGYSVTIFERDLRLGGMLTQTIPNFRLPEDVIERDLAYLYALGLKAETGVDIGRDKDISQLRAEGYAAVIVAIGLPVAVHLGVEGENLQGIQHGMDFLRKVAKNEAERIAGDVVVIGGGNVAVDTAMSARRLGAEKVTMICLEKADEMPAYKQELDAALEEGIEVQNGWGVKSFTGTNGKVSGIILKRCTVVLDDQARFRPQYNEDETRAELARNVIIAIGQRLESRAVGILNETEGVFAVGDAASGPSSIVDAMADGRRAAKNADSYLDGYAKPEKGVYATHRKKIGRDEEFHKRKRAVAETTDAESRLESFNVFESTLSAHKARSEAARCLRCHLRADLMKSPLPPDPWRQFSSHVISEAVAVEGVVILADAAKQSIKIAGTSDIKSMLNDLLEDEFEAEYCRWEINPMYTQRESELIQAHLQAYGEIPGGDELDDLF